MDSKHANMWNHYVASRKEAWGEEWGKPEDWDGIFKQFFRNVHTWERAIEIGAGAGKYTQRVLNANKDVKIVCADVSKKFLEVLSSKLNTTPDSRVTPYLIDFPYAAERHNCNFMEEICQMKGWATKSVDAVYSIDAMVHVEWQLVVSYIASAAQVIRPGGVLIMSLANACSPQGFDHLIKTVPDLYRENTSPQGQFHFTSPDAVQYAMRRFGFNPILFTEGRDLWVVAIHVGDVMVPHEERPTESPVTEA